MKPLACISILLLLVGCSLRGSLSTSRKPLAPVAPAPSVTMTGAEQRLRSGELYRAGLIARVGENFDAAFEIFTEAMRVNPHSAEIAYELALLYGDVAGQDSSRLFHMADSLLHVCVRLAPANKFYKIALIDNYTKQGRYTETLGLAKEVADVNPTAQNYLRLERLCELAEDYEGALYALDRLERIEGPSLENSLYKFNAYKQLGQEDQGFRAMEDLCRAFPTELRYRVRMGDLYYSGGQEDMALATYQDVLTLDPGNDAAQAAMLDYYLQKGDTANFNALVPVFLLNPRAGSYEKENLLEGYILENGLESEAVSRVLGKVLFADKPDRDLVNVCATFLGYGAESVPSLAAHYERLLQIDPLQDRVRLKLLQTHNENGDADAILRVCREGRLYAPSNAVYYFLEGVTLAHQGALDEALDILDDGTQYADEATVPSVIGMLYSSRAEILLEKDEWEEACAAYDSALVYDPGNPDYLANYATVLTESGEQLEKALDMSRHAVDAAPHDPLYLATYAYALACLERYEEAVDVADSAMYYGAQAPDWETNPEYGRLLDHSGDTYYHLGLTGDAVRLWQQSLSRIEDPEIRSMIQQKIRRRRL